MEARHFGFSILDFGFWIESPEFAPDAEVRVVMAKNLAAKKTVDSQPLRVETAAGNVSESLDKVIHERMRLGIISALAANEKLSFGDLKNLLNASDGNISVHARKLEDAGYITCEKSFKAGRR
jgi:DNA-binding transcriptional ArsR family regulator